MKQRLLLTIVPGFIMTLGLNYGVETSLIETSVLSQIPAYQKSAVWCQPLWIRPNAKFENDTLHKLNYDRLKEIQDPFIQQLVSLNGEASISLQLNIQDLTAEELFQFATEIEKCELRHDATTFILDWLIQSFLLGCDPPLMRLHYYADTEGVKHPLAQNLLGLVYGVGAKVKSDREKSLSYFQQASDAGLDQARINLFLLSQYEGREIPDALIKLLYDQVKQEEDREAAYRLGMYLEPAQRDVLLERAFKLNHPLVVFKQAELAIKQKHYTKAFHMYEDASQQNHAEATAKLSDLYAKGIGVETSREKAAQYRSLYSNQRSLFYARKNDGLTAPLREANEYPQDVLKDVQLTPWVASCLRKHKGDLHTQQEAWDGLKKIHFLANTVNLMYRSNHIQRQLREWKPLSRNHQVITMQANEFKGLASLQLNLQDQRIGDTEVIALGENLKILTGLTSLTLALHNNDIGEVGGKTLGESLRCLTNLTSLTLELEGNNLREAGGQALGESLGDLTNLTSLTLNLQGNNLESAGGKALGDGLRNLRRLISLELNLWYNSFGEAVGQALGESLMGLTQLTSLSLYLWHSHLKEAECTALGKSFRYLMRLSSLMLNLKYNHIGGTECKILVSSLRELSQLTSLNLDLQYNSIGEAGGKALGETLSVLTSLKSLSLDLKHNRIGEAAGKALIEGLIRIKNLTKLALDLKHNRIGEAEGITLVESLMELTQLTSLSLAIDTKISEPLKRLDIYAKLPDLQEMLSEKEDD